MEGEIKMKSCNEHHIVCNGCIYANQTLDFNGNVFPYYNNINQYDISYELIRKGLDKYEKCTLKKI